MNRPPDKTPIAIFDTGIACAAALNPSGVSEKLVRLMVEGEVTVFMSNRLRAEYEQTLTKPVFAARYAFMTPAYVEAFLARFDAAAERVPNPPTALSYPRDPNDEMLINLAVSVKADYLVTLDNDLLALPQYPDFANLPYQPRVLKPGAFLAAIEQHRHNPVA